MDGQVIIGTKLDTKDLEKELKDAERQLQQYEKEAEKLTTTKIKIEADISEYEKQKEIIEQATNERLKLAQTEEQVNFVLGEENMELSDLNAKYSSSFEKLENINNKIKANARNQALVNDRIKELNSELTISQGFDKMKKGIDDIGESIKKTIKKMTRWALAIFGIRGAYMAVRNAMNVISQNDKQMATDIEYMRYALAYALYPIVKAIVDLAKTLMQYVGYIAKAWFNVDIYAKASAKDFKKAKDEAKKMGNQLASFDEMNVLSDSSKDSSGTDNTPSFNLGNIENQPVPEWLKWIGDNGNLIIDIISGITGALIGLKLLGLDPIMALGLGIIVGEIAMLIQDIIDFIDDPSWENFCQILGDIAIIIGTIQLLMGGWGGIIAILVGLVIKNWDTIAKILGGIGNWIYKNVIKPVADFFTGLWNGIKNSFKKVWDFIIKAFSKGGKIFNGLKNGIVNVFKTVVNALISGINKVIKIPFDAINGLLNTIRSISILGHKPFKGLWKKNPLPVPKIPKLAIGGIINQPGRGVPVGSAIAGERGAEGVIPLTDSQQMALLGEAIGKYITINANITNTMNGRVISRELQKIQNENNFAYNR